MNHETVLIVDDNNDAIDVVKDMLGSMNYRLLTAPNGASGLGMAAEYHPDLILLDMNMPLMGGLEMLTALRRADSKCPVIFMTAYGSEEVVVHLLRLGVRDYLNKPFTKEELIEAVDRALGEVRLVRERDTINSSLRTAEAIRLTLVTLCHYLNNYLMALNGGLQLLDERLNQEWPDSEMLQLLTSSRESSANIGAVLRVLLRATNVKLTSYTDTTPMLDIRRALEKELDQLMQHRRK